MAAFSLATLRRGADLTPAIGIGGWYWPLAAARALGLAGLDTDVKRLFADWRAQFLRLQSFADACASGRAPTAAAIPAQSAELALPLQFPNKLVAIGANYADHLAEMGAAIVKTPHPVMFIKAADDGHGRAREGFPARGMPAVRLGGRACS